MRPLAELALELGEPVEDGAHLQDGVHSELRSRAVRGLARDLDLEPAEALVRHRDLELGRLGHDRGVGRHRSKHLLHAEARVLLVGHGGDDDVACEPARARLAAGQQGRRQARLHVVGAAAVHAVAVDPRHERIGHALDADRVHVRAQEQRATPAGAACADDHAGPAGRRLDDLGLEAGIECPGRDEARDLALAGASLDE